MNPVMEQGILAKVKRLALDEVSLMRTLPEIPIFSERRVQAAADLLFMIASYFSKVDSTFQQRQHEITRQQALLAEGLFARKQSESEDAALTGSPLQSRNDLYKEGELIDLIKMGDRKGAKGLLDELLGTTLFRSHEHIGVLKARALEIIFIIARAAVEAGANLEEILGFKYQYIQNLSKDDSQETLYYFLRKAFRPAFRMYLPKSKHPAHQGFHKGKGIYLGKLQSGDLAKKNSRVSGNQSLLSQPSVSKRDGGLFLDYLTSVRISIAKKLLKQTNLSMIEICLEVGYQDPSHFAKVFKKKEGVRPAEYRKNLIEQNIGGS